MIVTDIETVPLRIPFSKPERNPMRPLEATATCLPLTRCSSS
jgi:hypothetical protein